MQTKGGYIVHQIQEAHHNLNQHSSSTQKMKLSQIINQRSSGYQRHNDSINQPQDSLDQSLQNSRKQAHRQDGKARNKQQKQTSENGQSKDLSHSRISKGAAAPREIEDFFESTRNFYSKTNLIEQDCDVKIKSQKNQFYQETTSKDKENIRHSQSINEDQKLKSKQKLFREILNQQTSDRKNSQSKSSLDSSLNSSPSFSMSMQLKQRTTNIPNLKGGNSLKKGEECIAFSQPSTATSNRNTQMNFTNNNQSEATHRRNQKSLEFYNQSQPIVHPPKNQTILQNNISPRKQHIQNIKTLSVKGKDFVQSVENKKQNYLSRQQCLSKQISPKKTKNVFDEITNINNASTIKQATPLKNALHKVINSQISKDSSYKQQYRKSAQTLKAMSSNTLFLKQNEAFKNEHPVQKQLQDESDTETINSQDMSLSQDKIEFTNTNNVKLNFNTIQNDFITETNDHHLPDARNLKKIFSFSGQFTDNVKVQVQQPSTESKVQKNFMHASETLKQNKENQQDFSRKDSLANPTTDSQSKRGKWDVSRQSAYNNSQSINPEYGMQSNQKQTLEPKDNINKIQELHQQYLALKKELSVLKGVGTTEKKQLQKQKDRKSVKLKNKYQSFACGGQFSPSQQSQDDYSVCSSRQSKNKNMFNNNKCQTNTKQMRRKKRDGPQYKSLDQNIIQQVKLSGEQGFVKQNHNQFPTFKHKHHESDIKDQKSSFQKLNVMKSQLQLGLRKLSLNKQIIEKNKFRAEKHKKREAHSIQNYRDNHNRSDSDTSFKTSQTSYRIPTKSIKSKRKYRETNTLSSGSSQYKMARNGDSICSCCEDESKLYKKKHSLATNKKSSKKQKGNQSKSHKNTVQKSMKQSDKIKQTVIQPVLITPSPNCQYIIQPPMPPQMQPNQLQYNQGSYYYLPPQAQNPPHYSNSPQHQQLGFQSFNPSIINRTSTITPILAQDLNQMRFSIQQIQSPEQTKANLQAIEHMLKQAQQKLLSQNQYQKFDEYTNTSINKVNNQISRNCTQDIQLTSQMSSDHNGKVQYNSQNSHYSGISEDKARVYKCDSRPYDQKREIERRRISEINYAKQFGNGRIENRQADLGAFDDSEKSVIKDINTYLQKDKSERRQQELFNQSLSTICGGGAGFGNQQQSQKGTESYSTNDKSLKLNQSSNKQNIPLKSSEQQSFAQFDISSERQQIVQQQSRISSHKQYNQASSQAIEQAEEIQLPDEEVKENKKDVLWIEFDEVSSVKKQVKSNKIHQLSKVKSKIPQSIPEEKEDEICSPSKYNQKAKKVQSPLQVISINLSSKKEKIEEQNKQSKPQAWAMDIPVDEKKQQVIEDDDQDGNLLADAFKTKMKKLQGRLAQRKDTNKFKEEKKEYSKEELFNRKKDLLKQARQNMIEQKQKPAIIEAKQTLQFDEHKSTLSKTQTIKKVSLKDNDKGSIEVLNRLASGQKRKVPKKDMMELTQKNYQQLPEIMRKKMEESKREDLLKRIATVKELEKKRRDVVVSRRSAVVKSKEKESILDRKTISKV